MSTRAKDGNRPPGRPPLHGARALERRLKENSLDQRTTTAKLLHEIETELANDAGGVTALTSRERVLIRRCAAQVLILESIENWTFSQSSVLTDAEELLPVLQKGYIAHVNSLRLGLMALGLRPDRTPKLPSLAEYLQQRAAQTAASNGAGDSQGDAEATAKAEPAPDPPEAA